MPTSMIIRGVLGQVAINLALEEVMPVAVKGLKEKVIPAARSTAKEKVVPAVKNVKRKACTGMSNLKKTAVSRGFSESSEMFVATEHQSEEGSGRFVSVSRGLDEKFRPTWMPM